MAFRGFSKRAYLRTAWGTKLTLKVSKGNVESNAGRSCSGDIWTIAFVGGTPTLTEINRSFKYRNGSGRSICWIPIL